MGGGGARNALGGGNAVGGRSSSGGLKPAKSLCHLDGSGGPGFNRIITKVAQHFIRGARGSREEAADHKSGSCDRVEGEREWKVPRVD